MVQTLEQVLDKNIMVVDLDVKDKEAAILEMSKMLLDNNYINDLDSFIEDIYHRESLGSTGVGNYIAIPHGQSDSVLKNGIAIARLKEEIEWETLDDKGVKLICLFSVSNDRPEDNMHLKLLALLAGKLGNDKVVTNLIEAKSVDDITLALL